MFILAAVEMSKIKSVISCLESNNWRGMAIQDIIFKVPVVALYWVWDFCLTCLLMYRRVSENTCWRKDCASTIFYTRDRLDCACAMWWQSQRVTTVPFTPAWRSVMYDVYHCVITKEARKWLRAVNQKLVFIHGRRRKCEGEGVSGVRQRCQSGVAVVVSMVQQRQRMHERPVTVHVSHLKNNWIKYDCQVTWREGEQH